MPRADQDLVRAPHAGISRFATTWAIAIEIAVLVVVLLVLARLYVWAAVVAVLVAVMTIPLNGHSVGGWLRRAIGYSRRSPSTSIAPELPADLVPLAEWMPGLSVTQTALGRGGELGLIADGQAWTAVLALASDDELLADKGEAIDLDALSGLTRQDDIVFAGVQVVTYTVPAPTTVLLGEDSKAAASYREITSGSLPPTMRRTWLCLRLDPNLCLEAVARRGASNDGVYATLRFGLHRVQTVLKRQGIITRALTPIELYEVLSLVAGSGPEGGEQRSTEDWSTWTCDGLVHTGRMIRRWGPNASIGYQELQEAIADAPVLFAVTSYTFTPNARSTGGIRLVTLDAASAKAAMAHTAARLKGGVRLDSPNGVQVPTMLATVPLGRGGR